MANLTVINHVTLDGVMQAPGRRDEDRRDGFEHGGWAVPYGDAVMAEFMGKGMAGGGALLFGRRTYEDFAAVWPQQEGNPISALLNERQKYVASTTLQRAAAMGQLDAAAGRRRGGRGAAQGGADEDLAVLGSGELDPDADAPRPRRPVHADDPSAGPRDGAPAVRRRRSLARVAARRIA